MPVSQHTTWPPMATTTFKHLHTETPTIINSYIRQGMVTNIKETPRNQGSQYRTVPVFRPGLGIGIVRCTEHCSTATVHCNGALCCYSRTGTGRFAYRWPVGSVRIGRYDSVRQTLLKTSVSDTHILGKDRWSTVVISTKSGLPSACSFGWYFGTKTCSVELLPECCYIQL